LIEIEVPLLPDNLDKLFQISSFVDSKLPNIKKPVAALNFNLFEVVPDPKYKDIGGKMRIIPTARQLSIYNFTLNLISKASKEDRELIFLKNYPKIRSYRDLKRMYLDEASHETLRKKYYRALGNLCFLVNNEGIKEYLK
tara:strand:+ start:186 stop:605 length:420 start_codon:yes stop_codon:yes gene_type:complete